MFDLAALQAAVAAHGRVARVVIAGHDGSSPREAGAAMLVWATGQSGTIGGGALEFQAAASARHQAIEVNQPQISRHALGPALGQCCGGAVTLVTEVFHAANLPDEARVFARSLDGSPMSLAVRRVLDRARARGAELGTQVLDGWMIEPLAQPTRLLWIWGAGHVGRALVDVLSPLPAVAITWIDTAPDRFPPFLPQNARALPVPDPCHAVQLAPPQAEHLILTYSHALDLALCHALLSHGFSSCGLIGSATKWARFRSRLGALGHDAATIARIDCPIGDPSLGKHPQAIAIGVATRFLSRQILPKPMEITGT